MYAHNICIITEDTHTHAHTRAHTHTHAHAHTHTHTRTHTRTCAHTHTHTHTHIRSEVDWQLLCLCCLPRRVDRDWVLHEPGYTFNVIHCQTVNFRIPARSENWNGSLNGSKCGQVQWREATTGENTSTGQTE